MDKKRFDHIEQQMKTAADSWEPAFDETAWEHMEQMLEGEKDRKRPVAWWGWLLPLILILSTAGYFLLGYNTSSDKQKPSTAEKVIATSIATKNTGDNTVLLTDKGEENITTSPSSIPLTTASSTLRSKNAGRYSTPAAVMPASDNWELFNSKKLSDNDRGKMGITISGGQAEDEQYPETWKVSPPENASPQTDIIKTGEKNANKQDIAEEDKKQKKDKDRETNATVTSKNEKPKKEKKLSTFYFSVAGGIEGNGVRFPGINKFSSRAGFLVGYQLSERLSLQTGFFAGNKKYVAGQGDYKAKGGYWATVDIRKVDANCRVFEIPVALRYDFSPARQWNNFAIVGLSSYLMNKEEYAYDYIRAGNPYNAKASYKGNQHLLSVLRLNGGVERKLSQQFSVGIQPGLAIPLAGVGEGQIKLFSTELLLTLKYRPFKRSK